MHRIFELFVIRLSQNVYILSSLVYYACLLTQVIDEMIFAIGGFNGVTTIFNVECYDGTTDEWWVRNYSVLVMLHNFFSTADEKGAVNSTGMWRHLHFFPKVTYISILVSIKRQFKKFSLIWNITRKKLLSFPQWQPKTGTRQIWRIIFMGGHLLRKAV